MRIAIFHELPIGGARKAVNEIGKRLKKKHIVDLYFVGEKENIQEKSYYSKVIFYQFIPKIWAGKNWKTRLYKDTYELYKLYKLHKLIAKDIDEKKYDLVFVNPSQFTQSPFVNRFIKSYKIFYCHDPHYRIIYESILSIPKNIDFIRFNYEKINRFIRKIIDKQNFLKSDLVLANSRYTKNTIRKNYKRDSKINYLGVDQNLFKPLKTKKEIDILFIGSFHPVDGYQLLKDALSLMTIKPVVKIIAFEKEWISDEKIIRDLYRKSKIVVCLTHNEPFGLIPLEAMACETCVVAVSEAGYKDSIIPNKSGYLIPKNKNILSKKLEWLINHPNMWFKLGVNGRKHILRHWTWDKSVKNLEKTFSEMIKI